MRECPPLAPHRRVANPRLLPLPSLDAKLLHQEQLPSRTDVREDVAHPLLDGAAEEVQREDVGSGNGKEILDRQASLTVLCPK